MKKLMQAAAKAAVRFGAQALRMAGVKSRVRMYAVYTLECFSPDGTLKWSETIRNLMPNEGLDDVLDKYYKGSAYTAAHYVLLTDGTPTVDPTDTMASHPGWVEVTAYNEANRPTLVLGAVSDQSVDNSASKAVFTISTNGTTIGGAGLTTDNTKGGATGTLVSAAAFQAGDKTIDADDLLNVTVTCTAGSA